MSERKRTGAARQAGKLLNGTPVQAYAVGHGQVRLTNGAVIGVGVFAAAFIVMAVVFGQVLIPGFLLLWLVYRSVRPPFGVVATPRGLAVLRVSPWNDKPGGTVALLPPTLLAPTGDASVTVELGPERITFRRDEFNRLAAATAALAAGAGAGGPQAGAPTPGY